MAPFLFIFFLKSPTLGYCSRKPNFSGCCSFTFCWLLFWDGDRNVSVRQWHHAAFTCSSDDPTSQVWKLLFRLWCVYVYQVEMWLQHVCQNVIWLFNHFEHSRKGNGSWKLIQIYIPQIWMLPFTQCWLSSTVLQLHMVSTQQLVYRNFSIFRAHQIFPVGHVFFFFFIIPTPPGFTVNYV